MASAGFVQSRRQMEKHVVRDRGEAVQRNESLSSTYRYDNHKVQTSNKYSLTISPIFGSTVSPTATISR